MPNEATTFAEAMAENFEDVFLNEEHGAESVTLFPKESSVPRTFVALVDRMSKRREQMPHHEHNVELVVVQGPKTSAAMKGVDVGWSLRLSDDPPDVRRSFKEIVSTDGYSITARFERQYGGRSGVPSHPLI